MTVEKTPLLQKLCATKKHMYVYGAKTFLPHPHPHNSTKFSLSKDGNIHLSFVCIKINTLGIAVLILVLYTAPILYAELGMNIWTVRHKGLIFKINYFV